MLRPHVTLTGRCQGEGEAWPPAFFGGLWRFFGVISESDCTKYSELSSSTGFDLGDLDDFLKPVFSGNC